MQYTIDYLYYSGLGAKLGLGFGPPYQAQNFGSFFFTVFMDAYIYVAPLPETLKKVTTSVESN